MKARPMKLTVFLLPLLILAAPAAAQHDAEDETWSWCVADASSPAGKLRYFSDPFEGETGPDIQGAFAEYLKQIYTPRDKASGFAVTCQTDAGLKANVASLAAAKVPKPGVRDVPTGWRFHFE